MNTINTRLTFLAAACAMALTACGDKASSAPDATPAPTATEVAPGTAPASIETPADAPVEAAVPPANDKPAAVVKDCATEIQGTDAMQYNVGSITVPASCTDFKITLVHAGTMPVAAMGHDVVISKAADMKAIATAGISAGLDNDYVKPGDPNVIAHTKMIGGGETTSVSFPVSKIQGDGPYEFFCSFPGHDTVMRGSISVE